MRRSWGEGEGKTMMRTWERHSQNSGLSTSPWLFARNFSTALSRTNAPEERAGEGHEEEPPNDEPLRGAINAMVPGRVGRQGAEDRGDAEGFRLADDVERRWLAFLFSCDKEVRVHELRPC